MGLHGSSENRLTWSSTPKRLFLFPFFCVCGSFLLTCRFNGADDGRNLLLSPEPHHFQLGGAGLAFLGIPKFFFVFLGEEQRNTGWFIWSKSACYSPARAYVYSMGMNIHQPAAFSIPSHTAAETWLTHVAIYESQRIWSYGWWLALHLRHSLSPLFLSPSLSEKDEWALQFLFHACSTLPAAKRTPSFCWWDLSPTLFIVLPTCISILFENPRSRSPAFLCTSNREWGLDDV